MKSTNKTNTGTVAGQIPQTAIAFCLLALKQKKIQFILLFTLVFFAGLISALEAYAFKMLVDAISATPKEQAWNTVFWPIIAFAAILASNAILYPLSTRLAFTLEEAAMIFTKNLLFHRVLSWSYQDHTEKISGEIAQKIDNAQSGVSGLISAALWQGMWFLANLWVFLFFSISTPLLLIPLAFWIIGEGVLAKVFLPKLSLIQGRSAQINSQITGKVVDVFTNVLPFFLFSSPSYRKGVLTELLAEEQELGTEVGKAYSSYNVFLNSFQALVYLGTILILVYFYSKGGISIGSVVFFITITFSIGEFLWRIAYFELSQIGHNIAQLNNSLSSIVPVDSEQTKYPYREISVPHGEIEMKNVEFSYETGTPVLKNLSLHIPARQKLGIVGKSGAGKSTLVHILLHLFHIQSGEIRFDGKDISGISAESVWPHMSFIPQENTLFQCSIRENVAYGTTDVHLNKIQEACKVAHIHEFVMSLPKGYETLVGERGIKLSGGQRQRIAIARAVLNQAPILILDEATSALDSESEAFIQDSLKNIMEGRTIIAIAHRLSTLQNMDRIIVMDEWKIVEDGNHAELLELKGKYYDLYMRQVNGFLWTETAS